MFGMHGYDRTSAPTPSTFYTIPFLLLLFLFLLLLSPPYSPSSHSHSHSPSRFFISLLLLLFLFLLLFLDHYMTWVCRCGLSISLRWPRRVKHSPSTSVLSTFSSSPLFFFSFSSAYSNLLPLSTYLFINPCFFFLSFTVKARMLLVSLWLTMSPMPSTRFSDLIPSRRTPRSFR